jgi:hypothetical protein
MTGHNKQSKARSKSTLLPSLAMNGVATQKGRRGIPPPRNPTTAAGAPWPDLGHQRRGKIWHFSRAWRTDGRPTVRCPLPAMQRKRVGLGVLWQPVKKSTPYLCASPNSALHWLCEPDGFSSMGTPQPAGRRESEAPFPGWSCLEAGGMTEGPIGAACAVSVVELACSA